MVSPRTLRRIREVHPLHKLRRSSLIQRHVLRPLDRPIWMRLRFVDFPVRVRLIQHLAYIVEPAAVEPGVVALIGSLRRFGGSMFDVGANMGYYTWMWLSGGGPSRNALLLEPFEGNSVLVSETIRRSRCNAELRVAAAGSSSGYQEFRPDDVTGHAGSLVGNAREAAASGDTVLVDVVALDDVVALRGVPPAVVKLDVEGGELDALAGAKNLVAGFKTVWIIEVSERSRMEVASMFEEGYLVLNADDPKAQWDECANLACIPRHLEDEHGVIAPWRAAAERVLR